MCSKRSPSTPAARSYRYAWSKRKVKIWSFWLRMLHLHKFRRCVMIAHHRTARQPFEAWQFCDISAYRAAAFYSLLALQHLLAMQHLISRCTVRALREISVPRDRATGGGEAQHGIPEHNP